MANLVAHCAGAILHTVSWEEVFVAMASIQVATRVLAGATASLGLPHIDGMLPIRGSEEFGGLGVPERAFAFVVSGN